MTEQKKPLTKERFKADMAEMAKEYEDCFSNKTKGSQAQQQLPNHGTRTEPVQDPRPTGYQWQGEHGLGEED